MLYWTWSSGACEPEQVHVTSGIAADAVSPLATLPNSLFFSAMKEA
jgi:hypothetical protein